MRTVMVQVDDQKPREVPADTPVLAVLPDRTPDGLPVLGALVNNEVVSLSFPLAVNSHVEPLTLADDHGWRIYRWSLSFLLAKAVHETFPGAAFHVRHALGTGLYCTVAWPEQPVDPAPDALAAVPAHERHVIRLRDALQRLVTADLPLDPVRVSYEDAMRMFQANGQSDKSALLEHRNPPQVHLVNCDGFLDLLQEPMVHRTGLLPLFDLVPCGPGFVLQIPARDQPTALAPFQFEPHLFRVYQEHVAWGRILGITTVGQLNEAIMANRVEDFIQTAEALHEKKLAHIAEQIATRTPPARLVLIAGPSSAGKTTFAKRLITHLRVNGLQPLLISTDNYFVGDERNPRDAAGNLDYEHIESMDLARLNRDLQALLDDQPVHLPEFDFVNKRSRDREAVTQLGPRGLVVMEGLHCLNPQLTAEVDDAGKFRVYISALTQLAVDHNTRISTTDNRLLRRLVRDHRYRGHPALHTLQRWPSVQRGERRWIFPFQHLSDATFNSALDYELAVIKNRAAPLLNELKPHQREYAEARRLSGFLHNFLAVPPNAVPGNSILREYIGGSQLRY